MYRIRNDKFRKLVDAQGEYGLARTSQGAQISVSTLQKMYAGTYDHSPSKPMRERLAKHFKVREADFLEPAPTSEKQTG